MLQERTIFRPSCKHSPNLVKKCDRDITSTTMGAAYNRLAMSLSDSRNSLDRDRNTHALEHQSPRSVFFGLLVLVFLLGGNVTAAFYQLVRHRFDGPYLLVSIVLGILCFRCARIIYKRLGG